MIIFKAFLWRARKLDYMYIEKKIEKVKAKYKI
jgi:hypothetical protein